jgi:hypothetical protein
MAYTVKLLAPWALKRCYYHFIVMRYPLGKLIALPDACMLISTES